MILYGPHHGEDFMAHQEHLRLDFVLGGLRTASLRPLLTWALAIFLAGLLAGALIGLLVLSAAVPTNASHPGSHGARLDIAAVRAGNGVPSVELEARAGMESRHDRWAEPEGRRGSAVPHYSPASDHPSDAPAATPARTISDLIRSAATEFSVDPARLEAVAFCESSLLAEPRVGQAQELEWPR